MVSSANGSQMDHNSALVLSTMYGFGLWGRLCPLFFVEPFSLMTSNIPTLAEPVQIDG